jgi:hypothetical protein
MNCKKTPKTTRKKQRNSLYIEGLWKLVFDLAKKHRGSCRTPRKKYKVDESGRTMVEMLSVLCIVGIVSLVGLLGFAYAITKYQENESINEIGKTITGSRTGFLLKAHSDHLIEVHSGGKLMGYVPYRVPIRDVISAVDFNDKNEKTSSADYTVQKETFRTLVGADVSTFVDTPYEFSVRVARLYGTSGRTVCQTILGVQYTEDYVYIRDIKDGDTVAVNEYRKNICRPIIKLKRRPPQANAKKFVTLLLIKRKNPARITQTRTRANTWSLYLGKT